MSFSVQDEILKYIKNEKDLSRYKISTLERSGISSPSKKRIRDIEQEFINLQLEDIKFEDVADVAAAIAIYRSSRNAFYKTYGLTPPDAIVVDKEALYKSLEDKIKFFYETGTKLIKVRVQELNPVQNSGFNFELVQKYAIKNDLSLEVARRELDALDLIELLDLEPLTLAKKRARLQAAFYSMGQYLLQAANQIKLDYQGTLEDLKIKNVALDQIIDLLEDNVFKFYNDALEILPVLLHGTMGQNPCLNKIHRLANVLNFDELKNGFYPIPISKPQNYRYDRAMIGNLMFGAKRTIAHSPDKDSEKRVQNKVYGILLPIPRKGNEKLSMLYKEIRVDGLDLSSVFVSNFSNVIATYKNKEQYFKALLMYPLWRMIELANQDINARQVLIKLLNLKLSDFESINFNDPEVIEKINAQYLEFFIVDEDSVVLAPKTRSEEEGLNEISPLIQIKISEIKEDYEKLIFTTNEILFR